MRGSLVLDALSSMILLLYASIIFFCFLVVITKKKQYIIVNCSYIIFCGGKSKYKIKKELNLILRYISTMYILLGPNRKKKSSFKMFRIYTLDSGINMGLTLLIYDFRQQKKLPAPNLAFQAFGIFIGT